MSAKTLLSLLLATIVSSALAQSPVDWQPLLDQQNLVLREVLQTLQLTRAGAGDTNTCFDWYLNNQTAINEVYYTEYNLCVSAAKAAKKLLSEQSALERQDLLDDGQSICSALNACQSISDGLQFFQCYNQASSSNSPNLFNISVTSERIAEKLTISYQAINDTQRVCTTESRVKNVNWLTDSRLHLNDCLIGLWSPPATTDAPTEAPVTTDAPTEETTVTDATTEETTVTNAPTEATTETDAPTEATTETEASTEATAETDASTEAPATTDDPTEATTEADATTSDPSDGRQGLPEEDIYEYNYMSRMQKRKQFGRL